MKKRCVTSQDSHTEKNPNMNISDTLCVYGRWQDRDSCVLRAPQRTLAAHILAESCKETSRPFRKHWYRKWLYQPWFISTFYSRSTEAMDLPGVSNLLGYNYSSKTLQLPHHQVLLYGNKRPTVEVTLSSILEKVSGQPAALNKINKRLRDHQPTNMP